MVLFLLALLACDMGASNAPVPSKPNMTKAGAATRAWTSLLESGCDPKGEHTHVWTPLEARILRNVPYALGGRVFSSPELAAYFKAADGGWYKGHTKEVTLTAEAQACVATLQAHETKLRESWPVPPPMEARILQDPATFEAFWGWGHELAEKHYDLVLVRPSPDGGLSVQLMAPGCDPAGDCSAYVIDCDAKNTCVATAAG